MRIAWAAVAAGLVLAAGSAAYGVTQQAHPVDRGSVPTSAAVTQGPAPVAAGPLAPAAVASPGIVPASLDVGQLDVHASVVPVRVGADGALGVPDDPRTLGWWAAGPLPGSARGSVVIDGHVDSHSAGEGALFELRTLKVGALVRVNGTGRSVVYTITGLREYDKADLPADLFSRASRPRLVIVTCGGPFDETTRHYRDNIVAFGVQVSSPQPG